MSRIIPIILLIGLGFLLKRISFFSTDAKLGIDKIVIKISLPVLLFLSFSELKLAPSDIPLIGSVFLFCLILFYIGKAAFVLTGSRERLLPYLTTGLSFGLLGVPLYQTVFGFGNLGVYAKLGIGHELFFWLFFLTAMDSDFGNRKGFGSLLIGFAKSPAIIAIFGGIALGLAGLGEAFDRYAVLGGIRAAMQSVAGLASPLVLISVGYGLRIETAHIKKSFAYVGLRLCSALVVGFLIKALLLDRFVPRDPLFDHAYFLLTILPPVFSLPMFTAPFVSPEKNALANNVIVLYTIFTLAIFMTYVVLAV